MRSAVREKNAAGFIFLLTTFGRGSEETRGRHLERALECAKADYTFANDAGTFEVIPLGDRGVQRLPGREKSACYI